MIFALVMLSSDSNLVKKKGFAMSSAFSMERIFKVMELRKNPEKATVEEVKELADDLIFLLYSGSQHRNIAVELINRTEINNE